MPLRTVDIAASTAQRSKTGTFANALKIRGLAMKIVKGHAKTSIHTFILTRVAGVMSIRGEMLEHPALSVLSLNVDGLTFGVAGNIGLNAACNVPMPKAFCLASNKELFNRLSSGRVMGEADKHKLEIAIAAVKEFFRQNQNFGE